MVFNVVTIESKMTVIMPQKFLVELLSNFSKGNANVYVYRFKDDLM